MTEIHLSGSCGTRSVYHTKKDCPALARSNVTRTEELTHFEHLSKCGVCSNGGKIPGNQQEYDEKECDACGETYKKLPQHLRNCEGTA